MSNEKLLTVKEVADHAQISVQAVYKRMNKDFKPYVVEVENKKLLKYEVLSLFGFKNFSTKVENSTEVENLKKIISYLEQDIELLRAENSDLKEQLKVERETIRNQSAELLSLSSQVGESLRQLTTERAAVETQALANTLIENKRRHWWQKK